MSSMTPAIKIFALGIALTSTVCAHAQTINSPESLEFDAIGSRYLISNRGNGEILARSASGALSVFTADPASPAGVDILGDNLFVADGGFVRAYRLSDGVRVLNYAISGATFLNGISNDGVDRVWVSDFSGQRLHQLDVSNLASVSHTTPIAATGFTPNGLWWDRRNQRLLMVSWGANARVFSFTPGASTASLMTQTSFSNFDGIVQDCDGAVYVSSFGAGAVLRTAAPLTAQSVFVSFSSPHANPADIAYAPGIGEIAVPNAASSSLSFVATACAGVFFRDGLETR